MSGKWLVACSGGPDSMALVDMCLKSEIDISLAHVNYHHREQADEEMEYVKDYAKNHGVDCYVLDDEFKYEGNFEAEAREWRYDFFVRLVKEHNFKGVLVGHHQDDLLETFLMQEERNSEPSYYGLREENMYHGILVRRPLLSYTKKELQAYCDTRGIKYYIDYTNSDTSLTRNRIRHDVIDILSKNERQYYIKEIEMKNAIKRERDCRVRTYVREDRVSISQYRYLSEEERHALLRVSMDDISNRLSDGFIKEIDNIIMKEDDFVIDVHDYQIVQDKGYFFKWYEIEDYCDVYHSIDEILMVEDKEAYGIRKGEKGVNALSVISDDFPLKIRNYHEGDSIEMRFGKKKVSRFFIDRKIPKFMRKAWPVVENSKGEVIFVSGLGCNVTHFTDLPTFNVLQYPKYTS